MRRFCLRPEWQEYLVVITLVAICLERIRKFAAMRGMTNRPGIHKLKVPGLRRVQGRELQSGIGRVTVGTRLVDLCQDKN